ncbi:MAG: response regulator transcription factor [Dehalococcoidia bacterium]|nr:response regulator transcription factor [Dehalococcoidia bacterium]
MDSNKRILIVDDDPEILSLLRRGLGYEGYVIEVAQDGKEALAKARSTPPALVILDVMMPGIDGLEVCQRLRQVDDVPILMLSAKRTVPDRVAGLEVGADDYLVKPFAFDELLARVRALLRRRNPDSDVLRLADLTVDPSTRQVSRGQRVLELTTKEFDLLELFMRHPRQVLRRELIFERVWGYDFIGESNVIDVYIRYLRAKLQADDGPMLLHTVRGVGYVLKEP